MMGFMDIIKGQRAEAAEEREKAKSLKEEYKSAYKKAYEEEQENVKKEKAEYEEARRKLRMARAEAKAKRDVRNPLYKRLAAKVGAKSKEAVSYVAVEAGKAAAKRKAEKELITQARAKARRMELVKVAGEQERIKVRQQYGGSKRAGYAVDLLGGPGPDVGARPHKLDLLSSTPNPEIQSRQSFIKGQEVAAKPHKLLDTSKHAENLFGRSNKNDQFLKPQDFAARPHKVSDKMKRGYGKEKFLKPQDFAARPHKVVEKTYYYGKKKQQQKKKDRGFGGFL